MKNTIAERLLKEHLVEGTLSPGNEIGIRIDQTLTQDATGTMVYLEFESMGLKRVVPKVAVSYVDHNIIQTDSRNADDHRFLQSCASKYGVVFAPPGVGVSHHVPPRTFRRSRSNAFGFRQPHDHGRLPLHACNRRGRS